MEVEVFGMAGIPPDALPGAAPDDDSEEPAAKRVEVAPPLPALIPFVPPPPFPMCALLLFPCHVEYSRVRC
jgi:hypothetical protein